MKVEVSAILTPLQLSHLMTLPQVDYAEFLNLVQACKLVCAYNISEATIADLEARREPHPRVPIAALSMLDLRAARVLIPARFHADITAVSSSSAVTMSPAFMNKSGSASLPIERE